MQLTHAEKVARLTEAIEARDEDPTDHNVRVKYQWHLKRHGSYPNKSQLTRSEKTLQLTEAINANNKDFKVKFIYRRY